MAFCPGLALRTENETISYYKDFAMRSLLSKAEAGISGALAELFLDRNLLYALFFLLLAAVVWQTTRRLVYRLLVLIPLGGGAGPGGVVPPLPGPGPRFAG